MKTKREIYLELRNKILSEEIKPGEWLVERKLTEQYNVSRTPIREVLQMLAADGLVEINNRRGCMVKKLTVDDFVEIYTAREAIESSAARLTCMKMNEEVAEKLRQLRDQLAKIDIESDPSSGVLLGRRLHDLIIESCGNKLLQSFYEKLVILANLTRNLTKRSVEIEKRSRDTHLQIIDALLERNPEKVEQLMKEHLRVTCQNTVEKHYSLFLNS